MNGKGSNRAGQGFAAGVRRCWWGIVGLVICWGGAPWLAQGGGLARLTEGEVKAAFLLNVARFVEWPCGVLAGRESPLVIGIVGEDSLARVLPEWVRGAEVHGRPCQIRQVEPGAELTGCHVVYISRSLAGRTREILGQVRGRPVLTVSELEGFAQQGGMIGFTPGDTTVRFDVNAGAAAAAELRLSSRLLAVARSVVKGT